ncbi:MAG: pentapeptide repeat-containing protein, partial [Alphaproteobacteria bacterium]|nr:pentapeptide repeat-containing protein [Alphaproteobacteria bacterium]
AAGYSQGLEAGYTSVDGVQYGFVYEYDASPNQQYYCDYGIETGADAAETKKEVYESPVFAHQNKCTAMYFTTSDGRVVKITDENGKFISKEWEDFVKLHDARVRTGNKFDKMRVVKQLRALSCGEVYTINKSKKIKCLNLQNQYNIDLSGMDLSNVEEVKLPITVKSLKGTKLPKKVDWTKCYDIDLSGADLSNVENLELPILVKSVKGTKFPKQVDLSKCFNIDLSEVDLSNDINVKFPKFVKSFNGCKFPKNVDLTGCYNVDLLGVDLSGVENLKLPEGFNINKLPKDILNQNKAVAKAVKELQEKHAKKYDYPNFDKYDDWNIKKSFQNQQVLEKFNILISKKNFGKDK